MYAKHQGILRASIITFLARVHAYKVCCNVTRVDTPHELNNVAENIWLASRQKEGKTGRQARHADRQGMQTGKQPIGKPSEIRK